jgi:hypothetical protein
MAVPRVRRVLLSLLATGLLVAGPAVTAGATAPPGAAASSVRPSAVPVSSGTDRHPDFGANVKVFDPSMTTEQIQATVDAIAAEQVGNQFGPQRYSLLFKPGTYGTAEKPLNFQVGYYTTVAGLGLSPDDTVINGSVYVRNQCDNGSCTALNNFWRSLENLRINVTTPDFGCYAGEFWAVSQAAPMRRVHVVGQTTLMDYCTAPSFGSGGFIADSRFDGQVINGSQQQWMTRNSELVPNGWSNGVWNQVFSGVTNAPPQCFPADAGCGGPYTTIATSPVTREAPFLYVDSRDRFRVFVPSARHDSSGVSWTHGQGPGHSLPLSDFVVAEPGDDLREVNHLLAQGKSLLLTPGVYDLDRTLKVKRAGAVVLGLGMPTLVPLHGTPAMTVADVAGVDLTGVVFDAGPESSPVLLRVGPSNAHRSSARVPTALQDVFFRVGGAAAGRAEVSLEINSDHTILDNTWVWRADHGTGVGWTVNTADTGVVVNGDDVTAYGLFVEHFQKTEVLWTGERGRVVFFQNEMPYDPPSQEAWTRPDGTLGWPALKVADGVSSFHGSGMGSYSFFNQGVDIYAENAFEVPTTLPPGSLQDLLTVFLDPANGRGGILHVVNGVGGSSTIANPDVPVTVVSYP